MPPHEPLSPFFRQVTILTTHCLWKSASHFPWPPFNTQQPLSLTIPLKSASHHMQHQASHSPRHPELLLHSLLHLDKTGRRQGQRRVPCQPNGWLTYRHMPTRSHHYNSRELTEESQCLIFYTPCLFTQAIVHKCGRHILRTDKVLLSPCKLTVPLHDNLGDLL